MPSKNENETAYHQALKYLKYRPRTCSEIQNYLKEKNFSIKATMQTIQRLDSSGLINDRDFARLWVENRRRFKPKGRYALKVELKRKGIEDDIIDSALKTEDEEKNACAALQSKVIRWRHLDKVKLKKKVFSFLRSRGFQFEICIGLSDRFSENV